jgi:hypothetical protein
MVPPVLSIDLTDEDTGFQAPVDINYVDNGIRYSAYETSNNFQQYEYKVDGTGAISKLTKPKIDKLDGLTSTGIDDLIKMESAKYVEGYSHNKLPLKYIESKYVSNIYNLPLRFSFTILNNPKIKPGAVIQLIFPHNDEKELIDSSLSGNYLVTAVRKKESGLQYINDVYVASNSFIKPIPKA